MPEKCPKLQQLPKVPTAYCFFRCIAALADAVFSPSPHGFAFAKASVKVFGPMVLPSFPTSCKDRSLQRNCMELELQLLQGPGCPPLKFAFRPPTFHAFISAGNGASEPPSHFSLLFRHAPHRPHPAQI